MYREWIRIGSLLEKVFCKLNVQTNWVVRWSVVLH